MAAKMIKIGSNTVQHHDARRSLARTAAGDDARTHLLVDHRAVGRGPHPATYQRPTGAADQPAGASRSLRAVALLRRPVVGPPAGRGTFFIDRLPIETYYELELPRRTASPSSPARPPRPRLDDRSRSSGRSRRRRARSLPRRMALVLVEMRLPNVAGMGQGTGRGQKTKQTAVDQQGVGDALLVALAT